MLTRVTKEKATMETCQYETLLYNWMLMMIFFCLLRISLSRAVARESYYKAC